MKKHYYILGLKEGASQEEIQEAYERLSKELDPANNDNQEFFIEEYKKVQEAYKALSNSSILATDKGAKQIFKKPSSTSKNNNSTKTPIAESPRKSNKLLFIILGILFLVAIALSYVFLQPIDKNSLIEKNIKGDVKLLSEYSFVAIEKFGDAIKGEMKRENYETDYRKIYNEKGNIIEESNYETDGVVTKTIYKYDGNENKIETNYYYADGTLGVNSTSVFDDKGNVIKSSLFIGSKFLGYFNYKYDKKGYRILLETTAADSSLTTSYLYKNDDQGNIIESKTLDYDNGKETYIDSKTTYKYDAQGNKIESTEWKSDDGKEFYLDSKTTYKYDDQANQVEENIYNGNSLETNYTYKYIYDEKYNWIERIKFKNKIPVYILVREIEYYSDNISVIDKEMTSLGYFRKGVENRIKNNFKEAVEDYSKAISIDPNFLSAYYNRGISKDDLKDYKGAISDYTRAIEINPNYANAYSNRGISKHNLKNYKGAIADYTKAIEINPNNADAYYNRGISKRELKDYKGAISDYTRAIEINPNYANAYSNRGSVKDDLEDYKGAIADYNKAISIDPNYANAYSNRGISKHNLKNYKGAISDYTKAIEINPNDANAYYNRGTLKASYLKDYKRAISDFTKAIEINPNYADAYSNRGISKELLGDLSGACADWRKAANLGNTNSAEWVKNQCN